MRFKSLNNFLSISFLFICIAIVQAQDIEFLNQKKVDIRLDESYGDFERNKFDIILPSQKLPHGLIIFIHGGGFKHGDKKKLYSRKNDVLNFLKNNIAVVTINYRFYNHDDSMGVKLCLQDMQRAIQYIRFHADEYHIDKSRVGCYGSSAGAGSSLYFAFHDDLAIEGDTTLLGESTRLKCAGAIATQATYDVFAWTKIIPAFRVVLFFKKKMFYHSAANFYGYPDYKSFEKQREKTTKSLDMLSMIDESDPPVYLINLLDKTFPSNNNVIQHHRNHAIAVGKKLSEFEVENYVFTSKQVKKEKDLDYSISDFLIQHLK